MNLRRDERLNELAKIVTRGGGISDAEVESITASPFIHARLRARIEAERRRATSGGAWIGTWLVASRAMAISLVVTIAAALTFWLSGTRAESPGRYAAPDNLERVVTGGTCALSATEECAISNDEVLATLFAQEG